ncbi:hypothetical protein XPA_004422 [Xanthoria parietina]
MRSFLLHISSKDVPINSNPLFILYTVEVLSPRYFSSESHTFQEIKMVNSALWLRSLGVALVNLIALLYLSIKALGPRNFVGDCSSVHLSENSISESVAVGFSHRRQFVNGLLKCG